MKYYLINGKIMKGGEMPKDNNSLFQYNFRIWNKKLQPCEISESELDKIYKYLNIYSSDYNPIDVTNIIDENSKSGLINFYVESKQVDENSEAVEFAEWLVPKYFNIHSNKWNNRINEYDETDYTTTELYEIFKTKTALDELKKSE